MKVPNRGTRAQAGQILVMLTVIILGLWAGLQFVVYLSERAQQQNHLQHVADHATEAFAVIAARDLNYKSVTNRAMLANHIAIAQMTGLSSWFQMMNEVSRNSALVTSWIPYLNTVMAQLSRALNQLQEPVNQALRAGIQAENILVHAISGSQQIFHAAAAVTALTTSQQIVEKNDPSLELVLLNHATLPDLAYTWLRFQRRDYSNESFIPLLTESRDPFSSRRSYTWFRAGGTTRIELAKWGGTEVVAEGNDQLSWQAIDVTTLRLQFTRWIRSTIPVGRGGAFVGNRPPVRGPVADEAFGGAYSARGSLSRSAATQARPLGQRLNVPGHQRIDPNDEPPSITMVVRERPSQRVTVGAWAAAKAVVGFKRPHLLWPRRDDTAEKANLFNALWQAQLTPLSAMERWLLEQQV